MNIQKNKTTSYISSFIKRNAVMCIALLAAVITSLIIPVDKEYINYFDYKTLACLYCVLAAVCLLLSVIRIKHCII